MLHKKRCSWCLGHPDYIHYHDTERGVPLHDERKHFEMFILETMQAGLSRWTILQRREAYRKALVNFDPQIIATWGEEIVEELMQDTTIIRNRRKIQSLLSNAKAFLTIQSEYGSFDTYIWSFTNGRVIKNSLESYSDRQITSILSDTIAQDMKKRGFSFIGSITVYARLQAIGIINDHVTSCFRYEQV